MISLLKGEWDYALIILCSKSYPSYWETWKNKKTQWGLLQLFLLFRFLVFFFFEKRYLFVHFTSWLYLLFPNFSCSRLLFLVLVSQCHLLAIKKTWHSLEDWKQSFQYLSRLGPKQEIKLIFLKKKTFKNADRMGRTS